MFHIRITAFPLIHLAFLTLILKNVFSLELRPYCGFPGKPYNSDLSPTKSFYTDGDVVSYSCKSFWAAPQIRKCVNGDWEGLEARCGESVTDLLMKDSQMFDISQPIPEEKFHHTDMNITNRNWKYPNAFTSNRFKEARLAVHDDHEYMWQFNFTRPAMKLYVKVNFNFLNFHLQTEEFKNSHTFWVDVEISPYRTCRMQYQEKKDWRVNGSRYDTFFICESNSHDQAKLEIQNIPNYMTMKTKSSHNITYEFIALFFGAAYGTIEEPLCGEPPLKYGETSRPNQEFRDYMIGCMETDNWVDGTPSSKRRFNYVHKCIGDMVWNGTRPMCRPTKFCPLNGALSRISTNLTGIGERAGVESGSNKLKATEPKDQSDKNVVVDSIINYFHASESQQIFATTGTEVIYSCISDEYLLVGKDTRKCNANGKWGGNEPVCKSIDDSAPGSRNVLMIVVVVMGFLLCLILVISGILFHICTKKMKLKMAQAEAEKAAAGANNWQNDLGIYDNIEMNGKTFEDGHYEIYETVEPAGNEYTSYVENYGGGSNYDLISPHGAMGMTRNVMPMDDDYVKMLRYEHLQNFNNPPQNFRNDSFKRRDAEPSYLEIFSTKKQ